MLERRQKSNSVDDLLDNKNAIIAMERAYFALVNSWRPVDILSSIQRREQRHLIIKLAKV
jgi:hypothetical protein